jgi:hypothetical protein
MRIGRDDAIAMLKTWAADKALLRCETHFGSVASFFRARAREASDTRFWAVADDSEAELVLAIGPDFTFRYTDMRDSPGEEREFERLLMVFCPYEGDPGDADSFVLAEIKE